MKIEIFRDLAKNISSPDQIVEVGDEIPCRVRFLTSVDQSNPLNQARVLSVEFGEKFGARISWSLHPTSNLPEVEVVGIQTAIRELLIYAIDNAAELRDHLKARA